MKRKIFMLIVLYFLTGSNSYAQRLWDIEVNYDCLGSDTATETLKQIIRERQYPCFNYAMDLLAVKEGEDARSFLIDSLFSFGYMNNSTWRWSDYFQYQLLRGYYGDRGALAGMDSIIQFGDDGHKYLSITWLARAGYYEHFDALMNLFNTLNYQGKVISLMGLYGKDSRYRNTVTNILRPIISDSTYMPINYIAKCWNAIIAFAEFDSTLLVSLLDNRFRREAGEVREMIFKDLRGYDPDHQIERLIWVAPLEPNDTIRARYFPNYHLIESRRYLEPFFIKYMKDWQQHDASWRVKGEIKRYLEAFIPIAPPAEKLVQEILDSLSSYTLQMRSYNWLGDQNFALQLNGYLGTAQSVLNAGNQVACARQIRTFQQAVDREYRDSLNATVAFVTLECWKFLHYNAQFILDRLPRIPPDPEVGSISPTNVYANSGSFTLTVSGKNFVNGSTVNWNGVAKSTTFIADSILQASILASDVSSIDSPLVTVKSPDGMAESNGIRFYIKKQPVISGCNVKLINSTGTKLTGGTLQYYDGSWKDAVNNNDGTFFVNTTKTTLSLRMTYEYGTQTKSNVTVGFDTIAFQTVNAQIQLQNSSGVLILAPSGDTGTVQYYAGAWRNLGATTNGIAAKELLPANYSFRMAYAYASKDKQQDIGINPIVIFQTVNAAIQLQNSLGSLMPAPSGDQGTVQYYSGAWRELGITTGGVANKELLPNNYSFRMTYAYASKDKQQDLSTNPTVVFQTVNAAIQLQNSLGTLIDQGTVQYYSGAWRELGITTGGVANKELLPNNYSFRMTYAYASKDKQQDLNTNPTVVFQTVNAVVQLKNSLGTLIDQGTVQYYSGAWRTLGTTTSGTASKELLPNNYSFRMTHEYISVDKAQDISTNNTISFSTVLCTIRVKNAQNQLVNNAMASYYSGAWRQIGNTINGEVTKELLPVNLSFRIKFGTQQQDKQQNLSANNMVEFGIQ